MNPRLSLVSLTLAFAAPAFAQDAAPAPAIPTVAEIKKVLDFQESGKDLGPVLMDLIPCLKVDTAKGPTQYQCIEPVSGAVKKNTVVNAWVQFYCPKDGKYEDLTVQYLLDGTVRNTFDISVATPGKSRTWKATSLGKAGKWTIKVMRGTAELASTSVTVE